MSDLDQTVVDVSGLGLRTIAEALGRSRQAVDRGVRNHTKAYFRPDDVQRIFSTVCSKRPERRDQLAELIKQKYSKFANFIILATGKEGVEIALGASHDAVILVHDFEQFRIDLPTPFSVIRKLISGNCDLTFVTSTVSSVDDIKVYVHRLTGADWNQRRVRFHINPVARHTPIMLILDTSTAPKAFVTTFNDFAPLGEFQAKRLATNLEYIGGDAAEKVRKKNSHEQSIETSDLVNQAG